MVALFVAVFVALMWKGKAFLAWPLKWRLISSLSFAALMFFWIAWGWREHDKHELTMMYVCWDAQGHGQYPTGLEEKSTECANPERFSWPLKPKAVYFDTDHGIYSDYQGSFEEALKFWNKQLGVDALKAVKTAEEADITIVFGPVAGPEAGAARHERSPSGVIKGFITLTRPTDINGEYSIMAHELGHAAFGLAHDDTGIMLPATASDVMYLVTEPDKKAIREMLQP
jgi:hypothetical protein